VTVKTRNQPVVVIMGVSGSGKSTVAGVLAGRLGWDLAEGDDLHPEANVAKMRSGQALTDEDRWPWLENVAAWIRSRTQSGAPGIITCSALKKRYRNVLRGDGVVFVFLQGNKERIAGRLSSRHGHFMPPQLLESQFEALEPPTEEENAISLDVSASPAAEAQEIIDRLGLVPAGT
jgi:gluconokinase